VSEERPEGRERDHPEQDRAGDENRAGKPGDHDEPEDFVNTDAVEEDIDVEPPDDQK
jgi:hypothetical protein